MDDGKRTRPHWRLEHVTEQRVLKAGFLRLQELLTSKSFGSESGESAVRARMLRASFFERIMDGSLELKACPPNDVSAAQGDLRNLSLDQLLAIRIATMDFPTTNAGTFNVHSNFIKALSSQLFDKLGRGSLRGHNTIKGGNPRRLESLGMKIVLCLGAEDLAVEGADCKISQSMPALWLTPLDDGDWPGCSFLLANIRELWAEVLPGTTPDLLGFAKDESIVLVDLASVTGENCLVHWEIACLKPCQDDAATALALLRARRRRSFLTGDHHGSGEKMTRAVKSSDGRAAPQASTHLGGERNNIDSPITKFSLAHEDNLPTGIVDTSLTVQRSQLSERRCSQSSVDFGGPAVYGQSSEPTESSLVDRVIAMFGCCTSGTGRKAGIV